MGVKKELRKDATLLMLRHRYIRFQSGEVDTAAVTAYTVARWHSIPQSNAWALLNELAKSRHIKRHEQRNKSVIITYDLTKRGHSYINRNILECIAAQNMVLDWKLAKYKRSLLE